MNSSANKITVFMRKAGRFAAQIFRPLLKLPGRLFGGRRAAVLPSSKADHQLVYSLSPKKIPSPSQLKHVGKFLKPRELLAVRISAAVIIVCLIFLGAKFYRDHLKLLPAFGGQYTEALVGAPKYINPLYNYNRGVDTDLSALIFSGLFRRDKNGILQNDLADKWDVSADGKTYTITLKNNVRFSDGEKLTAGDVVFTFSAMQDADYNSPWRQIFDGVSTAQVDDYTLTFTLAEPYAAFRDLLTFGILPQNLWQSIDPASANLAELNLKPIGSGPYKFKSLTKSQSGDIKEYVLEANGDYYNHTPYINTLIFKFYPTSDEAVDALNNNAADGLDYLSPDNEKDVLAKNSLNINKIDSTQLAAVFFNQKNNTALADKNVRQALALAINKDELIKNALGGEAEAVSGPILPENFAYDKNIKTYDYNLDSANKILDDAGYKKITISDSEANDIAKITDAQAAADPNLALRRDLAQIASSSSLSLAGDWRVKYATKKGFSNYYLTVSLVTSDSDVNKSAAAEIKKLWEAAGVKTSVKTVPTAQIQSDVIKPRNFEALLFSQMVGADPDLYGFWDSSQAGADGLNIANYKNSDVDALLESARVLTDQDQRIAKYQKFQEIITSDIPAVFLYSPFYLYPQNKNILGFDTTFVNESSDRFNNVINWYVKTKKRLVWNNQ